MSGITMRRSTNHARPATRFGSVKISWAEAIHGQPAPRLPRAARRAALLVAVIACLTVCTLLMGTLMKSLVAAHRGSDQYEYSLQSLFLAEAGVRRAAAQMSLDPAYEGESWEIPADVLGRFHNAIVQIRVQPLEEDAGIRRIQVESQYPLQPQLRVVQTREILNPGPDGGES